MSDHQINLTGNLTSKALEGAASVDVLTAALKAEEKALQRANVAAQRAAVGSSPKAYDKAAASVKETTGRIALLRGEAARIANEKKIEAFYKGNAGAAIVSNSIVKKSTSTWAEFGAVAKTAGAGAISAVGTASKVAVIGVSALTVATVALGLKLASVAKDAISLGVGFADAGRSAKLLNEAADIAGGTHKQLTGIIEDVRKRSDLSRETISGYARELRILGFDSRKTQIILSAMAIAETTLGTGASSAVRGIAEQSRAMRRFVLGARDVYGEYTALKAAGLTKADLFAELAKTTGRSVGSVKDALGRGQISVKAGLAAIDSALRRKYGGTAQAQALSLTSQFRRMSEDFQGLFTGASIEPLLRGLKSITSIFSADTASGQAFQRIVSGLFSDLGKAAEALGPQISEALLSLSAEAAKPGGLATTIRGWIGAAGEAKGAITGIVEAIKAIGAAANAVAHPLDTFWDAFKFEGDKGPKFEAVEPLISGAKPQEGGKQVAAGVAQGVREGIPDAVAAVKDMGSAMDAGWRSFNKIQSPSKRYEASAVHIPGGAAKGVAKATPAAVAAVTDMSIKMLGGFKVSSGGFGGGAPNINLAFHAQFIGMNDAELEGKVKRWTMEGVAMALSMAANRGPQPRAA